MEQESLTLTRWSPRSAALEFGSSASTMRRRLRSAGVTAGADGKYSTLDIVRSLNAVEVERVQEIKARTENWELKHKQMRNAHARYDATKEALAALTSASLKVIEESDLSESDKKYVSENINMLPAVLENVSKRQSERLGKLQTETEDEQ